MKCLDIRMFGHLVVSRSRGELPPFPTRKSRSLFSFLVLNRGRFFPREVVIDKIFCEESGANGRKQLRNELWRVRTILEPMGVVAGTYITIRDRQIKNRGQTTVIHIYPS